MTDRMIFINLAVADLAASTAFFQKLDPTQMPPST